MSQDTPIEPKAPKTIPVNNLDQFVAMLTAWHSRKVAVLKHMSSMPEGTPVSFNEGEEVPFTGDLRQGFIMGLTVALAELGELPFRAELEDVPAANDPAAGQ